MQRVPGIAALPAGLRFAATLGVFDGVHRGHRAVIESLVASAQQADGAAVAIVFEPHPDLVLRGIAPTLLCDPAEREARLAALGVTHLVAQPFDRAYAAHGATEFVASLADGRRLLAMVMTPGSAFGRGREGTVEMVGGLGDRMGFRVEQVRPVRAGGAAVSSSRIRAALAEGHLAQATGMLGRRAAVTGEVVRGDGRGRTLGYPTANLAFAKPVALPPNGIYAVAATWGGDVPLRPRRRALGVASLGVRPTFGAGERVLEVHLLDFDEDLYGERLRVEFVRRQRGERRFATVAGLVAQMARDVARARTILTER
ncbi:MAG: riboflavin biosynthesis protein RibF [Candidatus Limnocylindrales bacterium]